MVLGKNIFIGSPCIFTMSLFTEIPFTLNQDWLNVIKLLTLGSFARNEINTYLHLVDDTDCSKLNVFDLDMQRATYSKVIKWL